MRTNILTAFFILFVLTGCNLKDKPNTTDETAQVTDVKNETTTLKNFERPIVPLLITNPQERAEYIIAHYWDKFNFLDTMYCHAPDITEQAFVDFLSVFSFTSPQAIKRAVTTLMNSAEASAVMYNYFFKTAEKYLYDPNSQMRNDEYFIPFLEHIVSSEKLTEASKLRPTALLELAKRNRPGATANNFTFTTASGQNNTLYNLQATCLLLIFYNPGCSECRHTVDMLRNAEQVTSMIASGKLKVLMVYTDKDVELWKKHFDEIPSKWLNSYDRSLTIRDKQLYDLKAIPTLYLLDKDKKVILKDASVADLQQYFDLLSHS